MNQAIQVLQTNANAGYLKLQKEDESDKLLEDIQKTLESILQSHNEFVTGFAKLGTMLVTVKQNKYWKEWSDDTGKPFESFGKFVDFVKTRIKKGRSQIYNTISVAEKLLPYTSEASIERMGISKASELAKIVKITGAWPSNEILEDAQNPAIEVEEFKAELYETYKVQKMDNEKGKYRDLGGFFATDEEWQEIQEVFALAEKQDPPILNETSEWARRKEIIWRLCAEFKATYGS